MISVIQERIKAIRKAVPNCLEELFEMSNRLCDLCGREIQDIMLAVLEHSIPVIHFARATNIGIEDATRKCNAFSNLRVAHSTCNLIKKARTRDEWFALGLDKKIGEPKILTEGQLLALQFRLGVGGRRYAELYGSPQTKDGCRKGGRIRGQRHKEQGTGIFAPENRGKSGRIAVESGQLAAIRTQENCSKGGRASGRVMGPILCHNRWHRDRGIINPDCLLCWDRVALLKAA